MRLIICLKYFKAFIYICSSAQNSSLITNRPNTQIFSFYFLCEFREARKAPAISVVRDSLAHYFIRFRQRKCGLISP